MGVFDQAEYNIRCEWGEEGVRTLAPISDVVVIVDVLSFSTSVDITVAKGATVYPYKWRDERVYQFARSVSAEVANPENPNGFSLSPSTLETLPENTTIVLPSPNGSTLSLLASDTTVLCGCLRNANAVASTAMKLGKRISVIPCGERWHRDYSLRPALEDFIGAGAILSQLEGALSPEAEAACASFEKFKDDLHETVSRVSSGKEKLAKEKERDIELATQINYSTTVPLLREGAYKDNTTA